MDNDFSKVNKQIANFIIVSAAIAVPVLMSNSSFAVNADALGVPLLPSTGPSGGVVDPGSMIYRYAGPVDPVPLLPNSGASYVERYAGPVDPMPQSPIPSGDYDAGSQLHYVDMNANTNLNTNVNQSSNEPASNYGLKKIEPGHFIFE